MPNTTKWRGHDTNTAVDPPSPRRPSMSPTLLPSSPYLGYQTWNSAAAYDENPHIKGLGLFGSSLSFKSSEAIQPDHLFIDQNGGAHVVGHKVRSSNGYHTKGGRHSEHRAAGHESRTNKRKNHTRSGSTIDDLANAAIATSPRFSDASPTHSHGGFLSHNHGRPTTSHIDGHYPNDTGFERPTKRIRSDMLHSAEWAHADQRPRTSHASDYQSPRQEEAELLLGLRYAWGPQGSPSLPIATLHAERIRPSSQAPDNSSQIDVKAPSPIAEESEVQANNDSKEVDIKFDSQVPIDDQMTTLQQNDLESTKEQQMDDSGEGLPMNPSPKTDHQVTVSTTTGTAAAHPTQVQISLINRTPQTPELKQEPQPKEPAQPSKKPRKIQPEVQAEVCTSCKKLQLDVSDEDNTTQWIGCEHCKRWFHVACVGFKDKLEARSVDKFYCKDCEGTHGTTTFVRKSSRARTAIDYAGLNQGVVKPLDESSMHHYIQPIKDGRIKYLQDDFARIRPELMTTEFWENMDGMKRPFVVPACWNPRFGTPVSAEDALADAINADPKPAVDHKCFDSNGAEISASLQDQNQAAEIHPTSDTQEVVIDTDQDYLDMVMPRNLTVRRVAELYGSEQPVPVIDVKSQETKGQFTLADWANYYEQEGDKPIRNVISLEVSNSRLGRLIRRPRVVRGIDLEDHVWDSDNRSTSNKRPVQFYCLMSVADSYTDFHIDFGGSSVYYHILKGVKTFFFIPPEDKYLKKYEEWCNSESQNDIWLGDMCGGNVTRVDLHEGDTAFIPAGWIHSVWTPEDSLVIGGNFLTRLDYDLQFKVANIEKTTNVSLKFRYPFFQKVMWYALLKYLEEDPVPEEVLRDFHEDEEYRYLRGNPIWMEFDDNDEANAEPGDPGFVARVYPKSELKGLPALRDYLYRTARIYADLPVSDINKRQIDAVKASIPKGHGDPMRLIKTFAVWCAWKIGNEKVPEWVHTDFGGLLPELKDREKTRKAEAFRAPPERVSARKVKETEVTPTVSEPMSPKIKAVHTPDSDDSGRKRNDPKSTGTRVACEACRKRRIKCRHKEGDVSPSSTSPAAIRPRTYSNISVDIPKLTSASPIMNGLESAITMTNGGSALEFSTDLAQAALASLHTQSSDPTPLMLSATPSGGTKKGRSKACEECRKSKRRCVHDEYGRVDPAKAAEPSKPRGSGSTKRAGRTSDEFNMKKPKIEFEIDPALSALPRPEITDAMIDPALMGDNMGSSSYMPPYDPAFYPVLQANTDEYQFSMVNGSSDDSFLNGISQHAYEPVTPSQTEAGLIETYRNDHDLSFEVGAALRSPLHDNSYSPITVDGVPPDQGDNLTRLGGGKDDDPTPSKQSSRVHRQVERYVPEDHRSPSKPRSKTPKTDRRASSEASARTVESTLKSRRSSSNTSGTTHHALGAVIKRQPSTELMGRPPSRDSAVGSEADADEKLARELQAAENGLRRRASVRI